MCMIHLMMPVYFSSISKSLHFFKICIGYFLVSLQMVGSVERRVIDNSTIVTPRMYATLKNARPP